MRSPRVPPWGVGKRSSNTQRKYGKFLIFSFYFPFSSFSQIPEPSLATRVKEHWHLKLWGGWTSFPLWLEDLQSQESDVKPVCTFCLLPLSPGVGFNCRKHPTGSMKAPGQCERKGALDTGPRPLLINQAQPCGTQELTDPKQHAKTSENWTKGWNQREKRKYNA